MSEEPTLSQLSFSQELTSSWQTMLDYVSGKGPNDDMLVLFHTIYPNFFYINFNYVPYAISGELFQKFFQGLFLLIIVTDSFLAYISSKLVK